MIIELRGIVIILFEMILFILGHFIDEFFGDKIFDW
jgi:hypothetical protein